MPFVGTEPEVCTSASSFTHQWPLSVRAEPRAPSIPIFPKFLSVPIIFLYFDEIRIFSYIIFTPTECRDAHMLRRSSYAKMHIVNIKN